MMGFTQDSFPETQMLCIGRDAQRVSELQGYPRGGSQPGSAQDKLWYFSSSAAECLALTQDKQTILRTDSLYLLHINVLHVYF